LIAGKKMKDKKAKIDELLNIMGLYERRLHKPSQLSGGEQQRVGLARAFVMNPRMILLDEPTGNLDSKTGTNILELLAETHQTFQTTIVMVTHSPVAAAYSERTVFLKDGLISASMERHKDTDYNTEAINRKFLSL
jgi:putative ABC transport system ATP-binding protein